MTLREASHSIDLRPMAQANPLIKITYRDYLLLPEESRYELIEGDLFMVPSPNEPHQRISRRLEYELITFVETRDLGEIYHAPFDVVLSIHNVVQPDIVFVAKGRKGIITEKNIQGAPDLVIEILSHGTSDRDLTIKRALYGKCGVKEYWIVDPVAEAIEVCVLKQSGMETLRIFPNGTMLSSPALPGLELDLNKIFKPR